MKQNLLAAACAALMFSACGGKDKPAKKMDTPAKTTEKAAPSADETAITDAIHGFFTWYNDNVDRIGDIGFAIEKGKHMTLDEKKLQDYGAELKKSGFVSDELVADETKYYQACAKIWATESLDQPTTGLALDRYLCAFDYVAPYDKAPVTATITGDRAKAVLALEPQNLHHFELKKENGKWLLSKPSCAETNVKY
jgi:hypothetical protein